MSELLNSFASLQQVAAWYQRRAGSPRCLSSATGEGDPQGATSVACIGLNFSPAPSGCDTFGLRRNAAAAQESGSLLVGKILG